MSRSASRRSRVRDWFRSSAELEASQLRDLTLELGAVSCADAELGTPVTIVGRLRTVTLRPMAGVPALEAELYDGSGVLTLVWLGRRVIRGITPGRTLVARGRVTRCGGRLTMYNPAYELRVTAT